MVLTRCWKILVLWNTNLSFLHLPKCTQLSMFHAERRLQVTRSLSKQYSHKLTRKEKFILEPEAVMETRTWQLINWSISEYHIKHQQKFLQLLKDNLTLMQNQMEQQANQHHNEISFDVGDWVFLWLQPYKKFPSSKIRRIINYHPSTMAFIRFCKRLALWHTNWSCLHLPEYTQFSMFHA